MSGRRPLTFFDLWCLGVNAIVGSSIFLFPGKLAALLGPASVAAFALTGLLLAGVALCFAEASARFDGHGGPYLYARSAFGPATGFAVGWTCWVAEILSAAAVANGIGVYLGYFEPRLAQPAAVKTAAALTLVVMGAVNYRGVKLGAWTSNALTLAKLGPLLLLAVVGLPRLSVAALTPLAPHGWAPLGRACFLAYFAFSGFECVPVPAGESRDAPRHVPWAVLGSLAAATLLYCAVQLASVAALPGLAASSRPLASAAAALLGPMGAAVLSAGAVVSMVGYTAGCALGGPRYLVAMAEHGDLPRPFGRLHERYATPVVAVTATAALSLAAALLLDFDKLVDIGIVVICAQYLATCSSVIVLRRRGPSPFKIPGGVLVPLWGIAATLWLGAQGGLAEIAWAVALLALGFAVRFCWQAGVRGQSNH